MSLYGGTIINRINPDSEKTVFSDSQYYYAMYVLKTGQESQIDFLGEYSVFVKDTGSPATVEVAVKGERLKLAVNDCLDLRGHNCSLRNVGDKEVQLLVVGTRGTPTDQAIILVRAEDLKKVFKPWGHELWINGANKSYSLKEVFLKAGRKTSLQYHRFKQETNVLFEGRAAIWFKQNSSVPNDSVQDADVGRVEIGAISSVDIAPQNIHRVEAMTDIRLYEASTPHLDDVIRLQDDNNRKSGTIESEHKLQIVILTAGKGDRMGGLCDVLNKALLPVKGKAVISRIIEKFPKTSRFVIALGYKGDQVQSYLKAAYPTYDFEFVTVDNYDKPGAGPGYSLKRCQSALNNKPFYFVACDTLVEDEIPFDMHQDWMGVCGVNYAVSDRYCNFSLEGEVIVEMLDKEPYRNNHSKSFIGLSYIHDTDEFWRGLADNYMHKGEWQMTNGIRQLISRKPVKAVDFRWTDVGSYQSYVDLIRREPDFDFGKTNEFIYFTNGRVVKFFKDDKIVENRVARARLNKSVFPEIDFAQGQFYGYPMVPGETLYERHDLLIFSELLSFLDKEVWLQRPEVKLEQTCLKFYRDKTMERIGAFFEKYPRLKNNKKPINGHVFPTAEEVLSRVDWSALAAENRPAFIHGDLQFDNILRSGGSFKLIDWRQDFGGNIEAGDQYYDLAKLYGGLVLNYDLIKRNQFTYKEDENGISFDFNTRNSMSDYRRLLEKYIVDKGFNLTKVRTLVGVIYLNMSPLHNYPFDKMLFALGLKTLHEALEDR